jgi:serine/threonine protein kinase
LPDSSRFCSYCGTAAPGVGADPDSLSPQSREVFEKLKEATSGRYEILEQIGRGGMAIVFLGHQKSLDRQVAIKVLLPFLGFDEALVQRFLREARTQGKLDHPSIIKVYEVHSEGGLTFFTMPFAGGRNLRAFLEDVPQPPLLQVQRYLCQAADALAYAHRRGVIHRDVKPDNMLLDEERDSVILTDFGIAKALTARTTLTTPGDMLGTPQYMSPEQGEGETDLDGRADQYSLGLLGYEMLAGRRPFEAKTLAELMYKHRFEEPENLDEVCPGVPFALRVAITRAVAKDREDRYPDMSAFLAALESCVIDGAEQELTEPMSRSDSGGEPTLRVATPSRRPGTPAGIEEEPGATYYPDYIGTPAATTGATSSSAAAEEEAGPQRRGLGRILLPGSVVAALALVVGLYFFGPLKPILQQGRPSGTSAPAAVEPGAGDREAGGAGDASLSGAESVNEGVEAEPIVAQNEEAGTTPAEDERPADLPPVTEDPDDSREAEADVSRRLLAAAEVAQGEVLVGREAAVAAGADVIFPTELAALDARLQETDGMLQSEQYAEATSGYSDLVRDYGQLSSRSAEAAGQGAIQAVRARREMQQQREAAVDAGARERSPAALLRAGMLVSQAREQFDAGNYGEAEALFRQAEEAYAGLVVDAPGGEDVPTEPGQPELTAEQVVAGMIDRFGELFAREDLPGMGVELYRRGIPRDDREFLIAVFDRAEDIEVVRLQRSLTVVGTSATADVRLRMRFNQSRTGASGEREITFRMEFVSGMGRWPLDAANPQR